MSSSEINDNIDNNDAEVDNNEHDNSKADTKNTNTIVTIDEDTMNKARKVHKSFNYVNSRQRAIDKYERGELDDEFRVVKMSNGKYRCYKRKEPLAPTPINVNQVKVNKPTKHDEDDIHDKHGLDLDVGDESISKHKRTVSKANDPMNDIVYYNLNNQLNEQLNKRIDSINAEIERLRNKNTKLKNKYKNLKQAIFIDDDEDDNKNEQLEPQQSEQPSEQTSEQPSEPVQTTQIHIPIRRSGGIDFNKFF